MNRAGESQALKLVPYQIVQATVAEGGMERVILKIKDHRLAADTKVPLRTGQRLNLQVMATSPQIHLRIMEEAELRHLFRLLHSFGRSIRLAPFLEDAAPDAKGVFQHLLRLLGSDPVEIEGMVLARLWRDLGLNMETLLAQGRGMEALSGLKAQLLMRMNEQGNNTETEKAAALLEHINLFQLCRYRLAQENVVFLPLPFEFLEQGYLLAERQRRREDREEDPGGADDTGAAVWKMNLNLKLSVLGNLEIQLLFEGQVLRMRILCEDPRTARIVSAAMDRLSLQLTTVSLFSCSVDAGARDPVMTLLERLAPEGDHFLEAMV
ncbi:MAG: hypothetical protein JRJ54_11285 [Deltaproteobacteria bacterium]|nr:hypothetical protein [Deltaproteobacteria bacterium]